MATRLTDMTIKSIKPGAVRREYADAVVPGLRLGVQASGIRSWCLRYRFGGRGRKLTIGKFPAISLQEARKLGRQALGQIAHGHDPGAEKQQALEALRKAAAGDELNASSSFERVAAEFLAKNARRWRPNTAAQATQLLRKEFRAWNPRAIGSITRADCHRTFDRILQAGHDVTANRARAYLSMLYSWAIERGIVTDSPVARMRNPGVERPRERVLGPKELVAIWRAAGELPVYGDIVRLLLLTGARRSEIGDMQWDEVDFSTGVWVLPASRAKNKLELRLPLPGLAIDILAGVPRLEGSKHVFTVSGSSPVADYARAKRDLDALLPADMAPWVFHDLRRSMASGVAELGVAPHVLEAVLNHRSGTVSGVAAVYNRFNYRPQMAEALQAWATRIQVLVAPNVVVLTPADAAVG